MSNATETAARTAHDEDTVPVGQQIPREELAGTVRAARRDPNAGDMALDFFLSPDKPEQEFELEITRVRLRLPFRVVTEEELKLLQKRATTGKQRTTGQPIIDSFLLNRMLVIECCTSDVFNSPQFLEVWPRPEDAIAAKLQPGEIDGLAGQIMEKSGFSDNAVVSVDPKAMNEVEQAKN